MAMAKEQKAKLELAVHQAQGEHGLQALRALLALRQNELNARWPDLTDEELTLARGEAKLIARLIKTIDIGPASKPMMEQQHG